MRSSMRVVHDFADAIINVRLAQLRTYDGDYEDSNDKEDLLGLYMRSRGADGEKLSKVQLRCVCSLSSPIPAPAPPHDRPVRIQC